MSCSIQFLFASLAFYSHKRTPPISREYPLVEFRSGVASGSHSKASTAALSFSDPVTLPEDAFSFPGTALGSPRLGVPSHTKSSGGLHVATAPTEGSLTGPDPLS